MHIKINFILLLILMGTPVLMAWDVTDTLQNGKDVYDGCIDSYLHRRIDSTNYENTNHEGENTLRTYYCPT